MLWVFMHIIFAGVTSILLFELLSNHRNNPFVTTLYNTAYPISDIGFPGQFSVIQYQRWQAGGQAEQKCPSVRTDQFVYWSRSVRMDGRTDRRTNEWATVRVLEHGRTSGLSEVFEQSEHSNTSSVRTSGSHIDFVFSKNERLSITIIYLCSNAWFTRIPLITIFKEKKIVEMFNQFFVNTAVYICPNNIISRTRAEAYAEHL